MKCLKKLRSILLISIFCLSFFAPQSYADESQALTIVYTANTFGKAKPCPS